MTEEKHLNIKKRAVGLAAVIGLAGGLATVAAPAAHAVQLGGCTGVEFLGSINPPLASGGGATATTAKTKTTKAGLHVWDAGGGTFMGDLAGVAPTFGYGTPHTTHAGANCQFVNPTNPTGPPLVFGDVQVSAKLSGVASCDSAPPPAVQAAEYPLNGKLGLKSTAAGNLAQAYIRVAGFGASPDVIELTGIITKTPTGGAPVGATLSGETFFDPVNIIAVKGVSIDFDGAGPAPAVPIAKGDIVFDLSQIANQCALGGAAISEVYGGDGTSLIGNSAAGLSIDV
jgi:hypothetical protein